MATFTWVPSREPTENTEPRVLRAPFGDGYALTMPDGINSMPRSWSVAFLNRPKSEVDAIVAFLREQGGAEAFDWVDPEGYAARWRCPNWGRTKISPHLSSLTATFDEVFGL